MPERFFPTLFLDVYIDVHDSFNYLVFSIRVTLMYMRVAICKAICKGLNFILIEVLG